MGGCRRGSGTSGVAGPQITDDLPVASWPVAAQPGPDSGPSAADHRLAAALAADAGDLLLRLQQDYGPGDDLRRAGDRESHLLLANALSQARPDDGFLSEEGEDDDRRLSQRRTWIVDPLDGTREFGERRADWAVHVALSIDGAVVAGAVALPARHLVCATGETPPAPPRATGRRLRVAVSRTRPPAFADRLGTLLAADLVPMGSAGAKAMAVVLGEVDAYAHSGGMHEWDSAAPVAVASAAGLHTSRLDGGPLTYNNPDPWLPDLLVCRPELAAPLIAACAP